MLFVLCSSIFVLCSSIFVLCSSIFVLCSSIFVKKITATQNEVVLSYIIVGRLYFLTVIFAATIVVQIIDTNAIA